MKNKLTSLLMCIIFASCIFFSYGFTICSVCVINENKNVLKSYYSTSDITTALSRALDYTKNNANKYNFLTIRISKGVYNVKTLHLSSYTTIDLNKSFIKMLITNAVIFLNPLKIRSIQNILHLPGV